MSYSEQWLTSNLAIRGLFIIATAYHVPTSSEVSMYISTHGFALDDGSVSFMPVLNRRSLSITESLNTDSTGASISFGDVEFLNSNGELDNWLNSSQYIWTNRPIKAYLGDPSWPCTTITDFYNKFLLVFDGVISDIDSRSRDTLNLKFVDKLERLNGPVTEEVLGTYGTWAYGQNNKDVIRPLVFGEVHNVEPLLIDPAQLEYMVNSGPTESVIEIRDNGVPIYTAGTALVDGANVNLTSGTFKLNQPSAGQVTVSVQGVKGYIDFDAGVYVPGTYVNNIANLIAVIVTQYGKANTRLSIAELDLMNFKNFQTTVTYDAGIVVSDRENVIEICQQLANSVGAQLKFTKQGKLQLLRIGVPTADAMVTITDSEIIENTLSITERLPVRAATKLAYCKNWTVQESLLTGIPQQHKDMFATEWFYNTSVDTAVRNAYKLQSDPREVETMLLTLSHAATECARINNYYKTQKTVYSFLGSSKLLNLNLGQQVTLIHNRFDLYNGGLGRVGQVVSLSNDWISGTVNVGVII